VQPSRSPADRGPRCRLPNYLATQTTLCAIVWDVNPSEPRRPMPLRMTSGYLTMKEALARTKEYDFGIKTVIDVGLRMDRVRYY